MHTHDVPSFVDACPMDGMLDDVGSNFFQHREQNSILLIPVWDRNVRSGLNSLDQSVCKNSKIQFIVCHILFRS